MGCEILDVAKYVKNDRKLSCSPDECEVCKYAHNPKIFPPIAPLPVIENNFAQQNVKGKKLDENHVVVFQDLQFSCKAELELSGKLGDKVGAEYTRYLLDELSRLTDPEAFTTQVKCLEHFGNISEDVATTFISYLNLKNGNLRR